MASFPANLPASRRAFHLVEASPAQGGTHRSRYPHVAEDVATGKYIFKKKNQQKHDYQKHRLVLFDWGEKKQRQNI